MPKQLHEKLKRKAREKGLKGERADAYTYGTLNKIEKSLKRKRKNG